MKTTLAVLLAAIPASALAQGFPPLGAPKRLGGGGGAAAAQCRQEPLRDGAEYCRAPDATPYLVAPRAQWAAELSAAGCADAARETFVSSLDASAALFNQGLLDLRQSLGMQYVPQRGFGCATVSGNWQEYAGAQRALLLSAQRDQLKAWSASCPKEGKGAPKPAARAAADARSVPLCRTLAGRAKGGCPPPPPFREDEKPSDAEIFDQNVCPKFAVSTRADVFSRRANFILSMTFSRNAAPLLFEAQGGRSCRETSALYERYTEKQKAAFVAAMLKVSGDAAAACRAPAP